MCTNEWHAVNHLFRQSRKIMDSLPMELRHNLAVKMNQGIFSKVVRALPLKSYLRAHVMCKEINKLYRPDARMFLVLTSDALQVYMWSRISNALYLKDRFTAEVDPFPSIHPSILWPH
jgi:hypothetical protein